MKTTTPTLLSSIGNNRINHFIWIYQEQSRLNCLNAFGSHYGMEGDAMFAELEVSLPAEIVEAAKRKEEAK